MNASTHSDPDPDKQAGQLLDVLIRAGLILALVLLCYLVFAPFLVLMVWALILAVSLYPLHQALARRIGRPAGSGGHRRSPCSASCSSSRRPPC